MHHARRLTMTLEEDRYRYSDNGNAAVASEMVGFVLLLGYSETST